MGRPFLIGVIGWGAIARRLAELLDEEKARSLRIAAIGLRPGSAARASLPAGAVVLDDPAELAGLELDLVIEAAGRAAVEPWGRAALAHAGAYAVCSTSAFCDLAVLERLISIADEWHTQLLIPPGALGGIDALAAAATIGLDEVVHSIVKPPGAWRGTAAEEMLDLAAVGTATAFFSGSARQVADRFPQNANAAVITALAGLGLDATTVELIADPAALRNGHHLKARGAFGRLALSIENQPLAANPKSSEMTALNLLRLVRNRVRPMMI